MGWREVVLRGDDWPMMRNDRSRLVRLMRAPRLCGTSRLLPGRDVPL
jgi:hypothetical protein